MIGAPMNLSERSERMVHGWGGRIRTFEWRLQRPLPYHLATPQDLAEFTRITLAPCASFLYTPPAHVRHRRHRRLSGEGGKGDETPGSSSRRRRGKERQDRECSPHLRWRHRDGGRATCQRSER